MKILVLGGNGQLGQCLQKVEKEFVFTTYYADEIAGNILDVKILEKLFKEVSPSYVINCAAYTAVDKAEEEIDLCRAINAEGAHNVAKLCKEFESTLIHISTDFVFDGKVPVLLNEVMPTNPISVYGLTKLEGEQLVKEKLNQHFIIRTSWLYSEFANNFMKTMLKLSETRAELGIIVDQVGSPTYAIDLARFILTIIKQQSVSYGTYHFSNEGAISWYDFAKAIFELSSKEMILNPLSTAEYPTKAERPSWSVMDKSKTKNTFDYHIPYWRESLGLALKALI